MLTKDNFRKVVDYADIEFINFYYNNLHKVEIMKEAFDDLTADTNL